MNEELRKMQDRLEQLKAEIDIQQGWLEIITEKVTIAEKLLDLLARECVLRVEVGNDERTT